MSQAAADQIADVRASQSAARAVVPVVGDLVRDQFRAEFAEIAGERGAGVEEVRGAIAGFGLDVGLVAEVDHQLGAAVARDVGVSVGRAWLRGLATGQEEPRR